MAQLVKNLPAMQEMWVQSLGWEDPLGKGKATHSSILACRIPGEVHGIAKSQTEPLSLLLSSSQKITALKPRQEGSSPREGREKQPDRGMACVPLQAASFLPMAYLDSLG